MENEKRYGGAIVVPDDVEMHSHADIVDGMVEALRFYESRTSAAKDNDLIRRGDLKNLLLKRSFFPAIVAAALKEIPKVDAVEVVRCKDCKHYDNSEGICWCHLNSKFYKWGTDWHGFPEDGFCSYGERKDNGSRT